MKKLLSCYLVILLIVFLLITYHLSLITPVSAQGWSDPTGNQAAQLTDLEFIFTRILNLITVFAVLAVFVMLILGGFKYLTSGGDQKAVESAQNTLTYAIFGLAALIGIWLILKFVEVFTGVEVTQFKIQP